MDHDGDENVHHVYNGVQCTKYNKAGGEEGEGDNIRLLLQVQDTWLMLSSEVTHVFNPPYLEKMARPVGHFYASLDLIYLGYLSLDVTGAECSLVV